MNCGSLEPRDSYQDRLAELNSAWMGETDAKPSSAPDGDVFLPDEYVSSFQVITISQRSRLTPHPFSISDFTSRLRNASSAGMAQ